jgi:hypothetical protein
VGHGAALDAERVIEHPGMGARQFVVHEALAQALAWVVCRRAATRGGRKAARAINSGTGQPYCFTRQFKKDRLRCQVRQDVSAIQPVSGSFGQPECLYVPALGGPVIPGVVGHERKSACQFRGGREQLASDRIGLGAAQHRSHIAGEEVG